MSKHQKRISAPHHYPVERKNGAYVVKAEGPYPESEGVPLVVVLRDVLDYADTRDEVEDLLSQGKVLVNQRKRARPRSTVGFMDVLTFPDIDEGYRVLTTSEGFTLVPVQDAGQKLVRVDDKTTRKGGVTQLNLHDGNNIETDDEVATKSSVLVTLPDLDIEDEIRLEAGNIAYIIGGAHIGEIAEVEAVEEHPGSQANTVELVADGETFSTVEDNVYMIGEDEPRLEVTSDE